MFSCFHSWKIWREKVKEPETYNTNTMVILLDTDIK